MRDESVDCRRATYGRRVASLALAALVATACGAGSSPYPNDERYPLARAQAVDPSGLANARSLLAPNLSTRSLLVERNGVVVMEEYMNGAGGDSAFDVRSITKSVMSLLVGIALDEGRLQSLDEPIGPRLAAVVPNLPDDKRAITVRQLLTMTSGIPWKELGTTEQDYGAFVGSPDPLRWILERPLEYRPGTTWHYNTGASHILSAVLTEAVGLPAHEYAQRKLFGPLDAEVRGWVSDPRGYDFGGHGISLTASALVKLGRLMLDGGRYRNRSIVPPEWIRDSTQPLWLTNEAVPWGTHYGYMWWSGRDSRTGLSFTFATGYGGQFIVLVPARNTVIAATTAWNGVPDAGANWSLVLRTIVEQVLPSLG